MLFYHPLTVFLSRCCFGGIVFLSSIYPQVEILQQYQARGNFLCLLIYFLWSVLSAPLKKRCVFQLISSNNILSAFPLSVPYFRLHLSCIHLSLIHPGFGYLVSKRIVAMSFSCCFAIEQVEKGVPKVFTCPSR